MRNILVILSSFVFLSLHINYDQVVAEKPMKLTLISKNLEVQREQPDYKLIYDTLITTLFPFIDKEIINYYLL